MPEVKCFNKYTITKYNVMNRIIDSKLFKINIHSFVLTFYGTVTDRPTAENGLVAWECV